MKYCLESAISKDSRLLDRFILNTLQKCGLHSDENYMWVYGKM